MVPAAIASSIPVCPRITSLTSGSSPTQLKAISAPSHAWAGDSHTSPTGISGGADLICGGKRADREGYFLEPTIFIETTQDMKLVREEIFRPVTCIQKFNDVDEVIDLANDTDYGLVGSVWTDDLSKAHKIAANVKAGTMGINTHGSASITAPFGRYKQSGWGREFGPESLDLYLQTKTICVHY